MSEPVMFRRLTRECAPEHGGRFAAYVGVGDLFAVCVERPGALLHDLAERRPLVYLLRGQPLSHKGRPLMVGVDYGAMLKASESVDKESPAGMDLADMLADYRVTPRVIVYSGSARYHYHEPRRLRAAELASERSAQRIAWEHRERARALDSK